MNPHYYNVSLDWTRDRQGLLYSDELRDTLEVATPAPFPGGIEGVWSPEHLLTASVLSCFMTTFLAIAEKSRLGYVSFSCAAKGRMEQVDGKYLMTGISLEPVLAIALSGDREKADRVLNKAEEACLITRSIRCVVVMKSEIRCEGKELRST